MSSAKKYRVGRSIFVWHLTKSFVLILGSLFTGALKTFIIIHSALSTYVLFTILILGSFEYVGVGAVVLNTSGKAFYYFNDMLAISYGYNLLEDTPAEVNSTKFEYYYFCTVLVTKGIRVEYSVIKFYYQQQFISNIQFVNL